MSTVVLKDQALQTYYEELFSMYGSEGWKKLTEDYSQMAETHNSLAGVESAEQLWFRKGQLDMIGHLLSHQAVSEHAHSELVAQQEGTDAETTTGGVAKVVA